MNKEALRKLYDVVSKTLNIGTFEEFSNAMLDSNRRKSFYQNVSKTLNIGTFEEFEKKIISSEQKLTVKQPTQSNNINDYPACVRFGEPKNIDGKTLIGIEGTGKFKGMVFFKNGRYVDTNNKVSSYTCKAVVGDNGITHELKLEGGNIPTSGTTTNSPKPKIQIYRNCNNFPFIKGCRNKNIQDIQRWIGFPKKYQTGNFGPITSRGLKDLKFDLSKGLTLDIYNQIKNEHQSPNTPTTEQPTLIPNVVSLSPDDTQPGSTGSMYNK